MGSTASNVSTLWDNVLEKIKNQLNYTSFQTWFMRLSLLRIDDSLNKITLHTDLPLVKDIIEERYIHMLRDSIRDIFGKNYDINWSTGKQIEAEKAPVHGQEFILNPKFTFENFVVGSNNLYAHAAAVAVSEQPAEAYNPLFLYGGSGLGKTHLMHAIGIQIIKNFPQMNVLYISSEMFTNELIRAIRENSMAEFKRKYRKVDVLLIDDIQFLEKKETTQEEFFHTFNALKDSNKQIVISSDRPANKLINMDERLRSRFQSNLIADISPPDYETRVAILYKKSELLNLDMDDDLDDVIRLISEKIKYNIREIEGAFTRVINFAELTNEKIDLRFAKKILKDILSSDDYEITAESIKRIVCKHFNIKVSDIESSNRAAKYSYPRHIAMYFCRNLTDLSLPKIGEFFGNRDHSTVIYSFDKISKEIKVNEKTSKIVEKLEKEIKGE